MLLGITRCADAEIEFAFQQSDEFVGMAKAAGVGYEAIASARRIAAQRQDVGDLRCFEAAEHLAQFIGTRAHARDVRHHVDPEFRLDALRDVDGAHAGRAARAVRHRDIGRIQ